MDAETTTSAPFVDRLLIRWTTTEQHAAEVPAADVMDGAEIDPDQVAEWIAEYESRATYEFVADREILATLPLTAED